MVSNLLSIDLKQAYEKQMEKLQGLTDYSVKGRYLQTGFGPVWINEVGPEGAPPLIALHGLHTPAPFNLELILPLTQHFRVICPDIPGQAGMTPGVAPLPSNQAYAIWLETLMDCLGIEQCPMVGLSFGGAMLLDMAVLNPQRITAASLIVPAGFSRPFWRPFKKLVLPLISFKLHTDQQHFDQLMKPVMGSNWPELEAFYFSVFQSGIPMTLIPPGPFRVEDLCRFSAPVQLFVANEDVYFSPEKQMKNAQLALPNLVHVRQVDDLHIPSLKNRSLIQQEVVDFMLKQGGMC